MDDGKQLKNFNLIQTEIKEKYTPYLYSYKAVYGEDKAKITVKLSEDNFIIIMFLDGLIYVYKYGYGLMIKTNSVESALITIHNFIIEKFQ